jgi:hypothetical protein
MLNNLDSLVSMPKVDNRYEGPAIVLFGQNSELTIQDATFINQVKSFDKYLTNWSSKTIPGARHGIYYDAPEEVAVVLNDFFE